MIKRYFYVESSKAVFYIFHTAHRAFLPHLHVRLKCYVLIVLMPTFAELFCIEEVGKFESALPVSASEVDDRLFLQQLLNL